MPGSGNQNLPAPGFIAPPDPGPCGDAHSFLEVSPNQDGISSVPEKFPDNLLTLEPSDQADLCLDLLDILFHCRKFLIEVRTQIDTQVVDFARDRCIHPVHFLEHQVLLEK